MMTTENTQTALDAVKAMRDSKGAREATQEAADMLEAGTINTSDYMYLVRWSEGRDTRTTAEWMTS